MFFDDGGPPARHCYNIQFLYGPSDPPASASLVCIIFGDKMNGTHHVEQHTRVYKQTTRNAKRSVFGIAFSRFSRFCRPTALVPRFCMIFRSEHDRRNNVDHVRVQNHQQRQPYRPPTRATIDTPTVHVTEKPVVLENGWSADSLVKIFPNTTCSEKNRYENFWFAQALRHNSQYRRRLAFLIFHGVDHENFNIFQVLPHRSASFSIEINEINRVDQANAFSHGRAIKNERKKEFSKFLGSTPWFCMIFRNKIDRTHRVDQYFNVSFGQPPPRTP